MKTPFIATHLKIILACWRYTYGFNRKEAELSLSFMSKTTGMSKRYISDGLNELINSNVLKIVKESTYNSSRIIAFNKNYKEWEYRSTVQQVNHTSTVEPQRHTTVEPQFNTTVELQFHQERKHKENIKTYTLDFEKFYALYPRAEEKRRTFTNWKTQLKHYSVEQLMAACENYKKAKRDTEKKYLKTSANFLGRERPFEDYIDYKSEQPKSKYPDMTGYDPSKS